MKDNISIFTNEILSDKIKFSLDRILKNRDIIEISCLPDIYQKEHTDWPSGITVVSKKTIFPKLLDGVGCGISLFKFETDGSIKNEKLNQVMEIVSNTIKDKKIIQKTKKCFKSPNPILYFEDFLNKCKIPKINEKWRNDTLSKTRLPNLDENTLKDYVNWPAMRMEEPIIEGNHFIEIQKVEKIYDKEFSKLIGISEEDLLLMVHLESEGLNIEIEKRFNEKHPCECIKYPSKEAEEYITLTNINQRYCFLNRIIVAKAIINELKKGKLGITNLSFVFETTHCGLFTIPTKDNKLIYHHTGSCLSLPPGNINLPKEVRKFGQPLILPGALGTESYMLKSSHGTKKSSFTVNHGLGRKITKEYARKNFKEEDVPKTLKYPNVIIKKISDWDLRSQMSTCYKDLDTLLKLMEGYGLTKKIAKIIPLGIIKA